MILEEKELVLLNVKVCRYSEEYKKEWDDFVDHSKNGTFLFKRDYIDYHQDRFTDFSLIFKLRNKVVALLPAEIADRYVTSHGGLTYGGLIVDDHMTSQLALELLHQIQVILSIMDSKILIYKTVPIIYHKTPTQEDLFALTTFGANIIRRDLLMTIDYAKIPPMQERRKRVLRKAKPILVLNQPEFDKFWPILTDNLQNRYKRNPVHTVEEIKLLHSRFPNNIRLYIGLLDSEIVGGAVIYKTDRVCHLQYNATTDMGREIGSMDIIINYLIGQYKDQCAYFDLGSCSDADFSWPFVNWGLIDYKYGFGARAIVHDTYRLLIKEGE